MSNTFVLGIEQYIGIKHMQSLLDIVSKTIREFGLIETTSCFYDNKVIFSIKDDDADTIGSCVNEIGDRVYHYMEDNCNTD